MPFSYEQLICQTAIAAAIPPDLLLRTEEIEVDGNVVGFAYDEDQGHPGDIQLFAEVGQLHPLADASLLRSLLEANFMGVGTGGCTLGIQQDANTVMLWGRFAIERLDTQGLLTLLTQFADVAGFWRERLDRPGRVQPIVPRRGINA